MPLCWLLLRDALRALAVHHVRRDPVGFSRSRPVRLYEHKLMKAPASIYIYIYIYIYTIYRQVAAAAAKGRALTCSTRCGRYDDLRRIHINELVRVAAWSCTPVKTGGWCTFFSLFIMKFRLQRRQSRHSAHRLDRTYYNVFCFFLGNGESVLQYTH
jgi:hypothetical protein